MVMANEVMKGESENSEENDNPEDEEYIDESIAIQKSKE